MDHENFGRITDYNKEFKLSALYDRNKNREIQMVNKKYCDYCSEDCTKITHGLEISIIGLTPEERDICDECAGKVTATLQSIEHKDE